MVTNPGYVALRVHRGAVVGNAQWPPILDSRTYRAAVARASDPARRTQRDGSVKHLLTGLARCAVCEGSIGRIKNRGYPSYACKSKFCVSRTQHRVDQVVEAVIVERLSRPDILSLLAGEDASADVAVAEAAELRARLGGFYEAAASGEISPMALARIESSLLPRVEDAERRAHVGAGLELLDGLTGVDAADRWGDLLIEQKRAVIRILTKVKIHPARRGARVFDPALIEITWRS